MDEAEARKRLDSIRALQADPQQWAALTAAQRATIRATLAAIARMWPQWFETGPGGEVRAATGG